MDDQLTELMQELGNAINGSLSDSDRIAAAIAEIKLGGYDAFVTLESNIRFNKREEAKEPDLASGKVTVSFKQAGLNEGTPTPLPLPSHPPKRPAGSPQPLARPSAPPVVALKMEDRLEDFMQELGNAVNGSLSDSDRIAAAIAEIKLAGYDVFVTLEATMGFNKRAGAKESSEATATADVVATRAIAPNAASKTPTSVKVTASEETRLNKGEAVQIQVTSPRQKVTITDGTLQVYQVRDLTSTVISRLAKGHELELGAAQVFEGREWIEANLGNGSIGYVLGPSVRSHTTLGKRALPTRPPATPASRAASGEVEATPANKQSVPDQKAREEGPPIGQEVPTPTREPKSEVKWEVLLRAAGPELFRLNAFRITGLAVDATASQITRQVEKLRLAEKFGGASPQIRGAFALDPPPDAEQLRAALQRLHDPEIRLVDEFFWFWPHDLDSAEADDALTALAQGGEDRAAEIWARMESQQSVSNVSMHNLAVMAHLRVLDLEQALPSDALDAKEAIARAEMWRAAFRRWKVLLSNEAFWSRLTARIHALDDPRLTTGTSRRTRESLPLALLLINAQLALRAARSVRSAEARRQIAVMQDAEFDQTVVTEALRSVIEPLRERIKTMCQAAAGEVSADAQHADSITRRLFEHSRPLLATIDCLLQAGDTVRDGAHDEVALQAYQGYQGYLAVAQQTKDWTTCVELLEQSLAIAASASAVSRIEESLRIQRENLRIELENKRAGTCFFCEGRPTDESAEIDVQMHGNVKRQAAGYNKINTTWNHATIKVPRCSSCATAHNNQSRARENVVWVPWVSCILYIVSLFFIGGLVWEGLGWLACILGAIATWVVPTMMALAAAHFWSEGVTSVGEQYGYFAIQKRKAEGWLLGSEPPGASVPTVGAPKGRQPILARWAFLRQHVLAGHNIYIRVWAPILLGLILLPGLVGLVSGGPSATRFRAQIGLISARSAVVRLTPELDGESALKTFVILRPLLHARGVDPDLAVQALIKALQASARSPGEDGEAFGIEAARELSLMGPSARAAAPALELAVLGGRAGVAASAAVALARVDPDGAREWAIRNLGGASTEIRGRALRLLSAIGPAAAEAVPALINATEDSDAGVRNEAMQALAKTAPDTFRLRVLAKLIRELRATTAQAREGAAEQLGNLGGTAKEALPALEKATQDGNPQVRAAAKAAVARVGSTQ